MKNLYVLTATRKNGDSFDVKVTFDKVEAVQAYESDYNHLTEMEKSSYEYVLWTYRYEGTEESATAAWTEMLDEDMTNDEYIIETEVMTE